MKTKLKKMLSVIGFAANVALAPIESAVGYARSPTPYVLVNEDEEEEEVCGMVICPKCGRDIADLEYHEHIMFCDGYPVPKE